MDMLCIQVALATLPKLLFEVSSVKIYKQSKMLAAPGTSVLYFGSKPKVGFALHSRFSGKLAYATSLLDILK